MMKSLLFSLTIIALLSVSSAFILFGLPSQFGLSYQHALSLQYDNMQKIPSEKVVVMGDSSVPFSLNAPLMEKILKMPVQTLGIHSGTGLEYILRLSESSIHKGDIMVLELEPSNSDSFTPSIVLTACENDFKMYQAFSPKDWQKAAAYYPSYLLKKIKYCFHIEDSQSPAYCEKSFDHNGNYDYYLGKCILPKRLSEPSERTEFNKSNYNSEYISYLNDYDQLCREKGATFLITFPPFLNESLSSSPNNITDLQNFLSKELHAPIITKISDRGLPRIYIYNNISHCNTAGANKVTADLAHDIETYRNRKITSKMPSAVVKQIFHNIKLSANNGKQKKI
jgi:hypothetical protein